MKLSIVIPVFNEEETIKKVLDCLVKVKLPCRKEIIIVDDGSQDKTVSIVKKFTNSQKKTVKFIFVSHQRNFGKGKAVQTGIQKASGEYILIQDADLEYNPKEIPKLLKPIMKIDKKGKKQKIAVYGSRFMNNQAIIPPIYYWGNKFLTFLTNIFYAVRLTDMETGYKLLPASFLKKVKLNCQNFDIEPEITAKLISNKIPIVETPISYSGRNHLAGKKLTPKDAFGAIKAIIKYRLKSA